MASPTDMTFQQPGGSSAVAPELEEPRAAVIEIVERHQGTKKAYSGYDSILLPNHLRINGAAVHATQDEPVAIGGITIGYKEVFAVTLRLMARALRVGQAPSFTPGAEDIDAVNGAVIEIPDYDEAFVANTGYVRRPYVLVNGRRILTAGPIEVDRMATHGDDRNALVVTLTLACRKLTVDDEPLSPPVNIPAE